MKVWLRPTWSVQELGSVCLRSVRREYCYRNDLFLLSSHTWYKVELYISWELIVSFGTPLIMRFRDDSRMRTWKSLGFVESS
jgi:hypothetical protein